jgi:hypothetical protein
LRRQDDHVVSRYQYRVQTGQTGRLEELVHHPSLSRIYDYYTRARTWQNVLQPSLFVIRRFERESFVHGSLYEDFLDSAGIGARTEDMTATKPAKESLDAESVEFLRMLNLLRVRDPLAAAPLPPTNRPLVGRLAAECDGPTLTMPPRFFDQFMLKWEDSNRRVALEFLGDSSGQLFRTPRKTRNTTTEQRLDPARLDYFLELLDIPEKSHGALRLLVNREAGMG